MLGSPAGDLIRNALKGKKQFKLAVPKQIGKAFEVLHRLQGFLQFVFAHDDLLLIWRGAGWLNHLGGRHDGLSFHHLHDRR